MKPVTTNSYENALERKFLLDFDSFWLTGTQALVRLTLEQHERDQKSNHHTAGYVTGYRGSPLAGVDQVFGSAKSRLQERDIVFQPAINEDLAATAAWGTQQVGLLNDARYDGVFSLWYGKAPGLDRSTDAIRHANMAGTAPHGGVLAVVGDDPDCKSSTLPSDSAGILRDLCIPILDPTDVGELIDYGLYGWALSRFSGCWSAMLAQTSVMDSSTTVRRTNTASYRYPTVDIDPSIRLVDTPHEQERRLTEKLALVYAFQNANRINEIVVDTNQPKLSIVTMGKSYTNVRQALNLLGLSTNQQISNARIRLIKLGLIWPVDRDWLRECTLGSQAILIVESKSAFLERELKASLYGHDHVPVIGKEDLHGRPLLTPYGELQIDSMIDALVQSAADLQLALPNIESYANRASASVKELESMNLMRKPLFCPGCPHTGSTKIPEGSRAYAGIGCHYMAQWMDRETYLFTHMGGEGANWIGQAPFSATDHVFVNIGDGTFNHSGLMAIRAAVAAEVNVTYKVLYNSAVAMTGGQSLEGDLSVADIVALVKAAGVQHVEVVAEDVKVHRGAAYPVFERSELDSVQQRLRGRSGCSVLIVDHACATEKRRKRKRGLLPASSQYVTINESVCEDCGDCVAKSSCSAIKVVETELGPKRQIEQSQCVQDLTCVDGYCPAIVVVNGRPVEPKLEPAKRRFHSLPVVKGKQASNILIAGVGGTGVITASQILAMAAHLDGKAVSTLDMTGLAQKGGAVISHLRIAPKNVWRTRLAAGECNLLIAADAVTATGREVASLTSPEQTQAVVNSSLAPSHLSVIDRRGDHALNSTLENVQKSVQAITAVNANAVADEQAGTATVANMVLLGMAYQQGLLPVSLESIRQAIELNGVAAEANVAAFDAGRSKIDKGEDAERTDELAKSSLEPLVSVVERRFELLRNYANLDYANAYSERVATFRMVDERMPSNNHKLTRSVAEVLYRLMSIKDEYEVARLLTADDFVKTIESRFGKARVEYAFAPTWLKGTQASTKVHIGAWFTPLLRLLAKMRSLRGTAWDPFRFSSERKLDKRLLTALYKDLDSVEQLIDESNYEVAVDLIDQYKLVKGFGYVREANWQKASQNLQQLRLKLKNRDVVKIIESEAA